MLLTDKTKNNNGTANSFDSKANFQVLDNSLGSHDLNNYSLSKSKSQSSSSANAKASPIDPNGSFSEAGRLGTLDSSLKKSGEVGYNNSYGKDEHDYWKFSVSSTREVSLVLAKGGKNADIAIYNSSGKLLQFSDKSIKRWLGKGDYYALVYNYGSKGTSYKLGISAGKRLSQYIKDDSVCNALTSSISDGYLNRKDMISILRSSKDASGVTKTEVKDLRRIVGDAKRFGIEDHVRVLANKVVHGSAANKQYRGNTLGNLYAGSTYTHMEKLVGKWFLGKDRPIAKSDDGKKTYSYKFTKGSLFKDGISYTDVNQGNVGNCYFMAGLAATAHRKPDIIKNMFTDNRDGTFTVKFYRKGVADYVTVDKYLPTASNSRFIYGNIGGHYNNSNNELWAALAEKAYAQLNESGWIDQDGTNSYQGISNGWSKKAMNHVTGFKTKGHDINIKSIIKTYKSDSNLMVTLNSKDGDKKVFSDADKKFVGNHAYVMTGYNHSTKRFQLYNPWGRNIEATHSQIKKYFDDWSHTTA